jgi:chorismate-pyruvate lyase
MNRSAVTNALGPEHLGTATIDDLVGPRWLAQDARPQRLTDVDFGALPVELRLLLIHDGTLTTALEAYQLAPIIADVEQQEEILLEADYAGWLQTGPGAPAVRRSTTLRHRISGRLLVRCEVHLLIERLPEGFLAVLANADKGASCSGTAARPCPG